MTVIDVYKYLLKKLNRRVGRFFKISEIKYKDYFINTFFIINDMNKREEDNKIKIETYIVNAEVESVGTKFEVEYEYK